MNETRPRPALHRSVFAKLVLIMLAMALCLIGLVTGFFRFFVDPIVGASVDRMLGDHARRIAAHSPGMQEARRIAARLDLQIRYQGPDGAWTTDASLPTIVEALADARRHHWIDPPWGHSRFLVDAPNGGRYLFAWEFGRRTQAAHDRLLLLLLTAMVAVFFAAHFVLSRALRPLRALQEGVSRLSAGDLDVALPYRSRDEFGVLTDAFNRMVARVKQMLQARDQLLLDVSHELRSPLTRLKVALALLPDSAKKAQAEADAAEMEAMIAELLEFERLRDGRALEMRREDLAALLRETARAYQDGPPGVRVSASAAQLPLELDGGGVRTVLRNLLGNAVKYSLPDSRPVEISATREADALVVRVVDDGPGIPEADLASLFEPFFRVDRSRSRKTGGYGLGLSICKRIVEAHGGRIAAANNPGRGACFTLSFPAPEPTETAPNR
jgi:signal transduction histidine kinase